MLPKYATSTAFVIIVEVLRVSQKWGRGELSVNLAAISR
jgi:hypothetical protein